MPSHHLPREYLESTSKHTEPERTLGEPNSAVVVDVNSLAYISGSTRP